MSEHGETPHVEARAGLASAASAVAGAGQEKPQPGGENENGTELGGEG